MEWEQQTNEKKKDCVRLSFFECREEIGKNSFGRGKCTFCLDVAGGAKYCNGHLYKEMFANHICRDCLKVLDNKMDADFGFKQNAIQFQV